MSRIPDNLESKYNKDSKFIWVDSQWEKFMTEQKELKDKILKLEMENAELKDEVVRLGGSLGKLIEKVPSKYLLSSDKDWEEPDFHDFSYPVTGYTANKGRKERKRKDRRQSDERRKTSTGNR